MNGKETNDELNHSPGFEPGYIYTLLHTKGGLRGSLTKSYFMACTKTTRHTSAAFYVTFTIITVLLDWVSMRSRAQHSSCKKKLKCFLQSKQLSNNLIGNVLHMSQLVSKSWLYITLPLDVCKRLWKENLLHRKVTAFKFVDYSKEGTSTF